MGFLRALMLRDHLLEFDIGALELGGFLLNTLLQGILRNLLSDLRSPAICEMPELLAIAVQ